MDCTVHCLLAMDLIVYLHDFCSYYLWSISHPGKKGTPNYDLSQDEEACVSSADFTPVQLLYERIITKVFKHYEVSLEITDEIRSAVKVKLWRMGKLYSKLGGKNRQKKLAQWKEGASVWNLVINESEVNQQLLKRKRNAETKLEEESIKRRKLEAEVGKLQKSSKQQSKVIARLRTGLSENSRKSSKPWSEYSRQQQYNRKRSVATSIQGALSFCKEEGFKPLLVEIENIDTGNREIVDASSGTFHRKESSPGSKESSPGSKESSPGSKDKLHSALYIKDKFCVSNEAFHELSMLSDLPNSFQVKRLKSAMNSAFDIRSTPNQTVGVQQSLRNRLMVHLTQLVRQYTAVNKPTIKIKLTGDGTQIARGLSVVNVAFTVLEEGQQATSVVGNHSIAILRVSEKYEDLASALEDIVSEAKDLEVVTVEERVYKIELFLGGDWKFLACICGLECATSEYACIWCKCPKGKRWDMNITWSLTDPEKGARTVKEISDKSKLAKSSKNRYNCCRVPILPFIPLQRVVIDSLHLFLRIADVLINLLIRDIRTLDGINKATSEQTTVSGRNVDAYVQFLNDTCKIRFQWYVDKESKKVKWRYLTGPEKTKLFKNINIVTLFPALQTKAELQELWSEFFRLVNMLGKNECDATAFDLRAKTWVRLFTTVYQSKDVTPYMHAFAMHVSEFLRLYGNIVMFTQQGLEKLNDVTTVHFQRSSNHREHEALKQLLEKRNRIEELEIGGFERKKEEQKCSICKLPGHNKRSCTHIS